MPKIDNVDIKIFVNIVSKYEQESIKEILYSDRFPWHYQADIAKKGNKVQKRPGFSHWFVVDGKENSNGSIITKQLVTNTCKKIKKPNLQIYNARTFLQMPLNENYLSNNSKTNHKEDSPHIDVYIPHIVFLYYVNDCDGETIIYDYKSESKNDIPFYQDLKIVKRVKPKQGRMIVFEGRVWHSSSQPTIDTRCIINFNMISR